MFWYLLIYFITGLVLIIIDAIIIIIRLYKKGYSIDKMRLVFNDINKDITVGSTLIGFMIWPIRLIQARDLYKIVLKRLEES